MQNQSVTVSTGNSPIIISMPHNGIDIPQDIQETMTAEALKVEDTDWYMDRLYDFAKDLGITLINPRYSRYVIDLNRDPSGVSLYPGADTTELCPSTTFKKQSIYKDGAQVSSREESRRVALYWRPYHEQIKAQILRLKQKHQQVLLFEAHSIASVVPRFFEGQLPDFNWGNNNGATCSQTILDVVNGVDYRDYTKIVNGRFKGGYITRQYADTASGIHTLQLELSQATYMDESSLQYHQEKAGCVKQTLKQIIMELQRCLS